MNVAFPALFLFLVVLPGFLFRQFFQRNEVRNFDHTPFSAAVLKALLCAAAFNLFGGLVAYASGYEIRLGDVIRLLVGGASALKDLEARLDWFNMHPITGVGYFALVNAAALISAFTWRAIVQQYELDRQGNWFSKFVRSDAPWYYLFSGLDHPKEDAIDGALIAAVVEFKEGSFLYTGILDDYEVNAEGQLDRIMLVQAQRRKLEDDRHFDPAIEQFVDRQSRFYPIAGDVFVLRYAEVKTFNVTYLSLLPPNGG
jgi:hypothetical protein